MSTVPERIEDSELVAKLGATRDRLLEEMGHVVVGQRDVLEQLILSVLCRGHCLLVGVPGLAKTVMVQTLGQVLQCSFNRIQFTPDLMPNDITGTDIIQEDPETGRRQYEYLPGPIFANIVLADEINRCPPKTQASLLEAMQERRVTCRGRTYELPDPFFVLATQNPIEQEGTYPLPEAQLDRFMFLVRVDYPELDDEIEILRRTTGRGGRKPVPQFDAAELRRIQALVRDVPAGDQVLSYAARLVRRRCPGRHRPPALGRRPACRADAGHGGEGPRPAARPLPCQPGRCRGAGRAGAAPPHRHQFRRPDRRHRSR